jgi:uncharacterized protein with PQ loop repeat
MQQPPHHHLFRNKKNILFFDRIVMITGVISPIMTIPQLLTIWSQKRAGDVSLYTWGAYLCGSLVWVTYGFLHKQKPIIFSNGLLLIVNAFIVLGILLYK